MIGGGLAAVGALVLYARSVNAGLGNALAASLTPEPTPTSTRPRTGTRSAPLPTAPSSATTTPPTSESSAPPPTPARTPAPAGCVTTLVFSQASYDSPTDWFSSGTWSAGSVVTVLEKRIVGSTPWFRVRSQAGLEAWIVPNGEQRTACFA